MNLDGLGVGRGGWAQRGIGSEVGPEGLVSIITELPVGEALHFKPDL